jgi:hypothetical protein
VSAGFKASQRRDPQYAAKGTDADRLRFVTSQLKLDGTRAAKWKLDMVSTGRVAVR